MDKATFDDYIKNRYEDQMSYYATASRQNRDKYRKFQWTLIILSALTPVMAALNGYKFGSTEDSPTMDLTIVVVIISAIVAILTTGLKTFNYYELWVTYRNTREELKREIYYYKFTISPYDTPEIDKESLFVSRVESILDKEHSQWPPARKLQEEKEKGGTGENGGTETEVENSGTSNQ